MKPRAVGSVDSLPSEVFGPANLTWWAAVGGEVIEGFVLLLAVFAYFYLAHDAPDWPPLHTALPSLGPSTINLGLMAASIPAAWWAAREAKNRRRRSALAGLLLHGLIGTAILVVRYFELKALNVRWDTNAYGSITWAILFAHGYMALFDVFDTFGLALLFARMEPEERHRVDVTENSFFWYFVVGTWIPIYLLVFWGPRL
jgi:heme/copper-type cytochrome/quinol oxidase subunit 3